MITLKRAQLGSKCVGGVDITVKSGVGRARHFAHSWDMVVGYKNGTVSWEEYTTTYREKLDKVDRESWRWLKSKAVNGVLTVCCYCQDGWQCHTHLLIDYLLEHSKQVRDGRGDEELK